MRVLDLRPVKGFQHPAVTATQQLNEAPQLLASAPEIRTDGDNYDISLLSEVSSGSRRSTQRKPLKRNENFNLENATAIKVNDEHEGLGDGLQADLERVTAIEVNAERERLEDGLQCDNGVTSRAEDVLKEGKVAALMPSAQLERATYRCFRCFRCSRCYLLRRCLYSRTRRH